MLERFKLIHYSLDTLCYSLQGERAKRTEQYLYMKNTCQKLANEKRSLNSINYHNSNTPT